MESCPCGSGKPYAQCCGLYIEGKQRPETPEALMRSRYTAYSRLNLDYIASTMKGPALEGFKAREALAWARKLKWQRLEVLATQVNGDQGRVEFKAYYSCQGGEYCMHEVSEFRCESQCWYYFDGVVPSVPSRAAAASSKIPRNDPCPCGSQRKYKKCCGAKG